MIAGSAGVPLRTGRRPRKTEAPGFEETDRVKQRPAPPEPLAIEHQSQLDDLCRACREEGRYAFDTEFVMEDRYEAEVCLVQIATADRVAIVDPHLDLDLSEVWELACDPAVETIVHAGQEDLAICARQTNKVPRRIFDVQIAAGFAGYEYPLSLQRLVQSTLHIRLHKAKTLADWRKRPLTSAMVRYGAEDVCYLVAIRDKLHGRLTERNRVAWTDEEFARFEDETLYRRVDEDKLARVKGGGSLRGQNLAVLHEVLMWREALAKRLNRPMRVILKDYLLVEIAKLGLSELREIRELRGINLSDKQIHSLCETVQKGLRTPEAEWPKSTPRDIETAKESALVALITAVIRGFCLNGDLAYGLVASKKSIFDLVRYASGDSKVARNDVDMLRGWRGETIGAMLESLLAGQRSIRVNARSEDRVIEVTGGDEPGN